MDIPKTEYESSRRKSKNGMFLYSKKNKNGAISTFFISKDETQEGIKSLVEIFELECKQFNFTI